ncbi:hypothetical protein LCGC14_1042630 [marine sediment metagenome]|uniref:Apea-like HEPN domain-containing protein n=1 Tax=marine sediment metagenome TaxID=412755 RepID=A0A0F9MR92_9ZZZZ
MKDIEEILQKKYKIRNIIYENISGPHYKIEYIKNNENRIIEIEEISDKLVEDVKKLYNIIIFPIQNNIDMRISGYNFTDIKLVKYENIIEEKKNRNKLIFEIDPHSSSINEKFHRVDLRESIEIYTNKELLFSGFITFIRLKKAPFKIFHVYCEDKFCILELSRIDDLFYYQKGSMDEIIKLHYDVKGFEILEDDLVFCTNKRLFRIIIPLRGLNIREKLNLGKCLIVPDLSEIKLAEEFDFLKSFNCFSILDLNRTSFYEAYQDGTKMIRNAINLLNFRIKIPNYFDGYDYYDQNSAIDSADYIYIQDIENKSTVIISDINSKKPVFEKNYFFYYFFRPVFGLANKYVNPEIVHTKKEKKKELEKETLILSYLNSAEKKVNEDKKAAFLDLWVSIELLVSRFKPDIPKLFHDNDSESIEENLKKIFEPKYSEIEKKEKMGVITKEQKKKIYEELKFKKDHLKSEIFRVPFNNQLERLLEEYSLNFSEEEKEIYKKARNKRHDIVHGNKMVKVSRKEYNIISKIIYLILKEEFFKLIKEERKQDFRFENPIVPIYFRMIIDNVINGLYEQFKGDLKFIEILKIRDKLSKLGMPSPKDIIPEYEEPSALILNSQTSNKVIRLGPAFLVSSNFLRKKDPRIPVLFDELIEKLGEFLVNKFKQNEEIHFAYEIQKYLHFIGDLGVYYRTFLNNIIWGLCEINPENKFFRKAQNDLNWLDKSGIQSYNVREAMKGFERWQNKKRINF